MNVSLKPDRRLLGGVLAGGRSSRMGADKSQLVLPSGRTLLEQTLSTLQSFCEQVCISVTQPCMQETLDETEVLVDRVSDRGPVAGVARLLERAAEDQAEGVFVLSVDLPELTAAMLQPIVESWQSTGCGIHLACGALPDHRPEPLIGVYSADTLCDLQDLCGQANRSLSRWLQNTPHTVVELPDRVLRSVNTPEQWKGSYERIKDA